MGNGCLFENNYFEITKDYKIVSFNDNASKTHPGIEAGGCCYETIMKKKEPCKHCPIAGNSDNDSPIFYDKQQKQWMEADFTKIDSDRYAVIYKKADVSVDNSLEILNDDDRDFKISKEIGTDINDILKRLSDRSNALIEANRQLFFMMGIIDLEKNSYENIYCEHWILDIVGRIHKASEVLNIVTKNLSIDYTRNDMVAFNDITTFEKRFKGVDILSHQFKSVTGDDARVLVIPIEYGDKKAVKKVLYGLSYSNHEKKGQETDTLTGLYNRGGFFDYASGWIKAHPYSRINVIVVDIKNFKHVNTVYGAKSADKLLVYLAEFVKSKIPNGVCGRYGADQIACIFTSTQKIDHDEYEKFLFDFAGDAPIPYVTIKVGIYENADREKGVMEMCDRALRAMKSIKNSYEKDIAYYDGPFCRQLEKTQEYESGFNDATRKHQFKIWYQPKYNPFNNELVGAEALVRWEREPGKFVPPGEFISVFERDGLIGALDEYVFHEVCSQLQKWKKAGKKLVPVSINLSRTSIRRNNIVNKYREIAEDYGIDMEYIPIEVTESAGVGNAEFKKVADDFHSAGFFIHMDDFGSEHSSLNGLGKLHLSTVKLDKSLVDEIGTREGDLVLEYEMELIKRLGLEVIAEGVENESQLKFLMDKNCECIQGYYYSRPLPMEEFAKLL